MRNLIGIIVIGFILIFNTTTFADDDTDFFVKILDNQNALDYFECSYVAALLGKEKLSQYLKYEGLTHVDFPENELLRTTEILSAHAIGYFNGREEFLRSMYSGKKDFDVSSLRNKILQTKCADKVAAVFDKIIGSIEE